VYRNDPLWVPTPTSAERHILDVNHHPFWLHARRECWIVRDERGVQGRIAAIVDDNHNQAHGEQVGFFGFFDVHDNFDAASLLLSTARDWVANQRMTKFRGPASPSLNYECGTLIDGFAEPPFVLMAHNHPYYPAFLERFGLSKVKDLYAYLLDITKELPPVIRRASERIRKSGLVLRSVDFSRIHEEIDRCRAVFDHAWKNNWGFVPMTDLEWRSLAQEFRPVLLNDLVMLAELNGQPAGMALCLPDINPILRDLRRWYWPLAYARLGLRWYVPRRVRAALIGVLPGQPLGIGAALYDELIARGRRLGVESVEISWILEDNDVAWGSAATLGGKRYKTYRMYEMPIASR
jgi:GNAT superfamily N-acetyltransferase